MEPEAGQANTDGDDDHSRKDSVVYENLKLHR